MKQMLMDQYLPSGCGFRVIRVTDTLGPTFFQHKTDDKQTHNFRTSRNSEAVASILEKIENKTEVDSILAFVAISENSMGSALTRAAEHDIIELLLEESLSNVNFSGYFVDRKSIVCASYWVTLYYTHISGGNFPFEIIEDMMKQINPIYKEQFKSYKKEQ